ncbi:MAG: hypothetical protein JRC87_07445 [Deltaproteobacteria bacterium]|nr:hypothetical protein [Deltaproteobacteria bacterium]
MINPFTADSKIKKIQQEVLRPLYTVYPGQDSAKFSWLLVETGRAISRHQPFIEEACRSQLVAIIFKIIKLLGGADQLSEDDFSRFTAYANDGGIKAMVKMLLSADKEKTFIDELKELPPHVRENAPPMLTKSRSLHNDFVIGFFEEMHGSLERTPEKLRVNFKKSDEFIKRLAALADGNLKRETG